MSVFKRNKQEEQEEPQEITFVQNTEVISLNKISCPKCGASISIEEGQDFVTCQFCRYQSKVTMESPDFAIDRGVLLKYSGKNREVEVPFGVRAIGILAFHQQNTLTKIVLPEGVDELQGSFYNCSSLETIILPDSLETIPPSTFTNCVSLETVVLPRNLRFLGELAFYKCISLVAIVIPPKVKFFDATVFMDCKSLETIYCYGQTKIIGDYFVGCDSLIALHILDDKTGQIMSTRRIVGCEGGYRKIK